MMTALIGRSLKRKPTRREWLADFVIRSVFIAVGVWVAAQLVDGIRLEGWRSTVLVAVILGTLNAFLKPLLFWGTLLLSVVTFGLFAILINTALLAVTAWTAGQFEWIHFAIDGFWAAFLGAVVISVVSFVMARVVDVDRLAGRLR